MKSLGETGAALKNKCILPFTAMKQVIQHIANPEILFYYRQVKPYFITGICKQYSAVSLYLIWQCQSLFILPADIFYDLYDPCSCIKPLF